MSTALGTSASKPGLGACCPEFGSRCWGEAAAKALSSASSARSASMLCSASASTLLRGVKETQTSGNRRETQQQDTTQNLMVN